MKILVTGGLGFIGSNFCRYLITKHSDCEITNIDKIGIGANPLSLKDLENDKRYTFVKGNICNSQILKRLIKKVDAVVNIAAETHVDRSIDDPAPFVVSNVIGTMNMLDFAGFCQPI